MNCTTAYARAWGLETKDPRVAKQQTAHLLETRSHRSAAESSPDGTDPAVEMERVPNRV